MLLATFSQPEYRPEFGTVVVRDTRASGPVTPLPELSREDLREGFSSALPCGSIARAGDGWLQTRATDAWQTVDLELHDCAPPAIDRAEDVVETPYICRTGAVALDCMTGSHTAPSLELAPGFYRVRVSRWPDPDGPHWCLQFWPHTSDGVGPRWLRRTRPVAAEDRSPDASLMADLVAVTVWADAPDVTLAELADTLLIPVRTVTETLRGAIAAHLVAVRTEVDAATTSVHLTALPSEAERQRRADNARLSAGLARTQAPAAAAAPSAPTAPTAPEPRPPTERAMVAVSSRVSARPPAADLVEGDPLRVGLVTRDGRVFLRHGDQLRSHATVGPGHWNQALESKHGIVVLGSERSVLVRTDGRPELLADALSIRGVVSRDGSTSVIDSAQVGRRSRFWLHCLDLATSTRDTIESDTQLLLVGIHDTAIYYQPDHWSPTLRWIPGGPPEPLPYRVRQVDPITGTLVVNDGDATLLVGPDGATTRSSAPPDAQLTPGAQFWYLWEVKHPNVVLHLSRIDGQAIRSVTLPVGSAVHTPGHPIWEDPTTLVVPQFQPRSAPQNPAHDIIATRIDINTGAAEAVTAPHDVGRHPTLIVPLPIP